MSSLNRLFMGAAILRSPVNIDAVRSIFGQGHLASVLSKHRCRAVDFRTGARGFRSFENLRANDDSTLSVRPIIFMFPHASYSTCMCIN